MLFASEWARKGLCFSEEKALTAKKRPLQKLCLFGWGFQKSFRAIKKPSHLVGYTRGCPPIQPNLPVVFVLPQQSLGYLIKIYF